MSSPAPQGDAGCEKYDRKTKDGVVPRVPLRAELRPRTELRTDDPDGHSRLQRLRDRVPRVVDDIDQRGVPAWPIGQDAAAVAVPARLRWQ